jgi:hypothetical protein
MAVAYVQFVIMKACHADRVLSQTTGSRMFIVQIAGRHKRRQCLRWVELREVRSRQKIFAANDVVEVISYTFNKPYNNNNGDLIR